ncbi:MAG: hypothetical protein WCO23_02040 [bacterium]
MEPISFRDWVHKPYSDGHGPTVWAYLILFVSLIVFAVSVASCSHLETTVGLQILVVRVLLGHLGWGIVAIFVVAIRNKDEKAELQLWFLPYTLLSWGIYNGIVYPVYLFFKRFGDIVWILLVGCILLAALACIVYAISPPAFQFIMRLGR